MCELVELNRSGSGPGTPSLAVVRPLQTPRLIITERDEAQLRQWKARAQGAANRLSLFDELGTRKPELEVVPWRFRYEYQCAASGCRGHRQTIVDWEVLALWRKVRRQPDWREQMRIKFEDTLWTDRHAVLFVGNQEQRPASFLVWASSGPKPPVPAVTSVTHRVASPRPVRHDRAVPGRIYSVGYEGLTASALVDRLTGAKVTKLIDVRLNPSSRRPGFSRKSLSAALESAEIEYVHEPELGNPQENREAFRQGDVEVGRRRVREMLENGAGPALQRLVDAAQGSRVAVLCVEREQVRCHRQVITDMALERNPALEVLQIL